MATVREGKQGVLLVVDVQVGVMAEAWDADRVVANVALAVERARAADVPVLWVQHAGDDRGARRVDQRLLRRVTQQLVVAGDDGFVRLFDSSGAFQRQLGSHAGTARSVAFSRDGSWMAPHSASRTSASSPHASAILWKRSLKAPLTSDSTRLRAPFLREPSISPVAEEEEMYTGLVVRKTRWSDGWIFARSSSIPFPRCPIMGRVWAASTSSVTSVGPGRKKLPNGAMVGFPGGGG